MGGQTLAILAIVGGQYGSEGKGVIVSHLADRFTLAVRTGGPNAGHSLIKDGKVWKMRSVPCTWVNPRCAMVIGPGGVIDPATLIREVNELEAAGYDIRPRLMVDENATVITHRDIWGEETTIANSISSTGEGVGWARMRKISRGLEHWVPVAEALKDAGIRVGDSLPVVNMQALIGSVLLEGTQGFGLSLHHGQWPYVTSANCTAAQLASDAGLGITGEWGVMVVFRAFPIRVGGPSGPLSDEMTWDEMSTKLGKEVIERTTVTNKVRRIGRFNWEQSKRAVVANAASSQVLTFADYIDPLVEGMTRFDQLTTPVRSFIDELEDAHGIPVTHVGTGGPSWAVIDRTTHSTLYRGDTGQRQDNSKPLLS